MNYTQLKSTVADWLHRSDLGSVLPTFIKLAESRINRDLRVDEMVKVFKGISADGRITIPNDFRQVKGVLVNGKPLMYVSNLESRSKEQDGAVNHRTGGLEMLFDSCRRRHSSSNAQVVIYRRCHLFQYLVMNKSIK